MTLLEAFFLGCMVALTPSLAAIAFLLWRQHSSRLLIEELDIPLEDQLAVDLRALIPIIIKDTHALNETEIAARTHLIGACRQTLMACGFNVLHTGGVGPRPASIEDGHTPGPFAGQKIDPRQPPMAGNPALRAPQTAQNARNPPQAGWLGRWRILPGPRCSEPRRPNDARLLTCTVGK
jgi:hypothetical protein